MTEGESDPSGDDPLGPITESFLERVRRGERPSVDDYAARHPELSRRIRSLFPAIAEMERLAEADPAGAGEEDRLSARGFPVPFGRYDLLRELGRGGMATVFHANNSAGAPVALKVLNPELGSTVGAERFRREIRVAARLQHPNILSVLDSGTASVSPPGGDLELLWFTMPYVDGINVWERFEQERTLPPD